MMRVLNLLTNLFPVWVVVASGLALAHPPLFTWFDRESIIRGLSVLMTMGSTFGAIVLTPLLTKWLAGTLVPVDGWGLFRSTVQAKKHFIDPATGVSLAAVPCAVSAVCHSVLGSLLAALWRVRVAEPEAAVRPGFERRYQEVTP